MNNPRLEGLMPLYGRREKGRQETVNEVERLHQWNRSQRIELARQTEFERMETEKPVVEASFQRGSLLPFLELRAEQAQARWEARIELLKERYTHAHLEADLKKAFKEEQALEHARRIHDAIMAHPQTLKLLRQGINVREERNRVIIGSNELTWMLWAAQHRQQLHDAIVQGRAVPGMANARPAARWNPTGQKSRWTPGKPTKARIATRNPGVTMKGPMRRKAA